MPYTSDPTERPTEYVLCCWWSAPGVDLQYDGLRRETSGTPSGPRVRRTEEQVLQLGTHLSVWEELGRITPRYWIAKGVQTEPLAARRLIGPFDDYDAAVMAAQLSR